MTSFHNVFTNVSSPIEDIESLSTAEVNSNVSTLLSA